MLLVTFRGALRLRAPMTHDARCPRNHRESAAEITDVTTRSVSARTSGCMQHVASITRARALDRSRGRHHAAPRYLRS